jgi:hypothetical protein
MRTRRLVRRGVRRARRPLWVARLRRLNRAVAASSRMIDSTMEAIERASGHAAECPVRTTRELQRLSRRLSGASLRLSQAVRAMGDTSESMLREPERAGGAPRLLIDATARWARAALALDHTSAQLLSLQEEVLEGLCSGEIIPESDGTKRLPRIVVTPRIISAREFLLCRRKSARDRIASIPARRRRTACRATTDAPRRISRGRAPPLSSTCLL